MPSELTETSLFLVGKINEVHNVAADAHESATNATGMAKGILRSMAERDESVKREFDQLRRTIEDSSTRNEKTFDNITQQLKVANDNLNNVALAMAKFDIVRDNQVKIKAQLEGQYERFTAHVSEQANVNGAVDHKIANLSKNTAKDYDRLNATINTMKDDLQTYIKETAPSVQMMQFIKWLVSIVVIALGVTWTAVQIYEKLSSKKVEYITPVNNTVTPSTPTTPPTPTKP